jgi:hypothetical protein
MWKVTHWKSVNTTAFELSHIRRVLDLEIEAGIPAPGSLEDVEKGGVSPANQWRERIELREQLYPPNAVIAVSGTVTPDIAEHYAK